MLGSSVRMFLKEVCTQYKMTKLPNEITARGRKTAALSKNPKTPRKSKVSKRQQISKPKDLNLLTYKYHALGDYLELIARFGTTDNASTQTVRGFLNIIQK